MDILEFPVYQSHRVSFQNPPPTIREQVKGWHPYTVPGLTFNTLPSHIASRIFLYCSQKTQSFHCYCSFLPYLDNLGRKQGERHGFCFVFTISYCIPLYVLDKSSIFSQACKIQILFLSKCLGCSWPHR